MFDEIYWTFIDSMYYGPFTSLDERVELLEEEDGNAVDDFVREKMAQERGVLDDHYTADALVDI